MPKDDERRLSRIPEEAQHRLAVRENQEKQIERLEVAYDTIFWDAAAQTCLAALAGKGGKELEPKYAAEVAAEYADALLKERKRRAKK